MATIKLPFKESTSKIVWSWIGVIVGSFLVAAAYVLFNTPYKITPGGVYGLAIIVNNFIPDFKVGTLGLAMDVPLLIISLIIFGKNFGAKTILSALLLPFMMNGLESLVGGTDPSLILGGRIDLSGDVLLASIYGGTLIGIGLGIIVKSGATSGGTDVIAMIITKYLKLPFSKSVLIVEAMVILTGMIVFGSWVLPLYSLISLFLTTKLIDVVIEGASTDKMLFIISDKYEDIKEYILNDLERGGTYFKASGMYTQSDKMVIFVTISRKELPSVREVVGQIDPKAFITVVNTHEIMGSGFKSLTDK